MAITRKMLKGMDLTEEQIETIIDQHTETVEGLKEQISEYKADAEKLASVQKELDKAKTDLETEKKSSWKVKYDALKEEYDDYKTKQTKKETHSAKESAYRELLKDAGVSEKRIAAVLKVSDVDGIELDTDGKVKDADKLTKSIKDEWADFIPVTESKGANTPNPPANTGKGTMSKDDIFKIKDPVKRQNAIAENIELFQNNGKDE